MHFVRLMTGLFTERAVAKAVVCSSHKGNTDTQAYLQNQVEL